MAPRNDRPSALLDRPPAPVGTGSRTAPTPRTGSADRRVGTSPAGPARLEREQRSARTAVADADARSSSTAPRRAAMDPDVKMMLWVMLFFALLALYAGAVVAIAMYAGG